VDRSSHAPLTASIIVNNYNYGQFVGEAIESALAQTYPYTQVIVVDDGSTDDSRDVIAGYEHRTITVLKPNGGQASAINLVLPICAGEAIYMLDADDLLEPDAVELTIPFFADPNVCKVHWPLRVIDAGGKPTGEVLFTNLADGDYREQAIQMGPANHAAPSTSGNAWRRQMLEELFPVPEQDFKNIVDSYLYGFTPFFGEMRALNEPLTRYRMHEHNLSHALSASVRIGHWEMRAPLLQAFLAKRGIETSIEQWREQLTYNQQLVEIIDAGKRIHRVLPRGAPYILIAEHRFDPKDFSPKRTVVRYPPLKYRYGTDEEALAFVEECHRNGMRYLALDGPRYRRRMGHLTEFERTLRKRHKLLLDRPRILVFDLDEAPDPVPTPSNDSKMRPTEQLIRDTQAGSRQ